MAWHGEEQVQRRCPLHARSHLRTVGARHSQARSPKDEKGNRKNKFHQWLTDDIGHPMLAQHIHAVIMLQRLAIANGQGWVRFHRTVDQVMPKKGQNLELPGLDPEPTSPT